MAEARAEPVDRRGWLASDVGLILAVAIIHSGGWIAAGISVGTIAPMTLAALRFLLAGAILLIVARYRREDLGTSDWKALLAVSLIGVSLAHAFFYSGLRLAPVADGVVLSTALAPTLAVIFAVLFLHERISRVGMLGVLISGLGVSLVVLDATNSSGGGDRVVGDALLVAGAVATAVYTVIGRVAMRTGTPLGVVASSTFIGGVALIPLALLEGPNAIGMPWSTEVWLAFLYLTLPSATFSAVLYYVLIRRSGATRASLVAYVVPVIVLAWSTVVFDEPLTIARIGGALLAIVGVRLVLTGSKPVGPESATGQTIGEAEGETVAIVEGRPGSGFGFTVRPMTPADVPAAKRIMLRTFDEDFRTGYQPEVHSDVERLEEVYLRTPRQAMFVAIDEATGEVVGTAGVRDGTLKPGLSPEHLVRRYANDHTAQLVRVYTLREHRRRGIAGALVNATLGFVVADGGYSIVALHTYPHSPGAIGFWEAMGATIVADDRDGPSRAVFLEMPASRARTALAAAS